MSSTFCNFPALFSFSPTRLSFAAFSGIVVNKYNLGREVPYQMTRQAYLRLVLRMPFGLCSESFAVCPYPAAYYNIRRLSHAHQNP